jgi:excisionase family DNA binding protein
MNENALNMPEIAREDTCTYISVSEMAKLLSIARATAYQLTKIDGFPCFYVGKRIIIPLSAFKEWAEKQANNKSVFFEK